MSNKLRIKNRRQLDAAYEADQAVLQHRARRAGDLVREATPGEVAQFAVGGRNGDCGCGGGKTQLEAAGVCRPTDLNDCYHKLAAEYGCPLKVTSGGVYSRPGGAIWTFNVQPIQSNYFLPVAGRFIVRDSTNPDTRRYALVTAVSIRNIPQENYYFPQPDATTVGGMDTSSFFDKISGEKTLGVEVAWGPFAREAFAEHLQIIGFSQYAVNVLIGVRLELWGYEVPNLPKGWECGKHPTAPVAPPSNAPRAA